MIILTISVFKYSGFGRKVIFSKSVLKKQKKNPGWPPGQLYDFVYT